MKAKGTTRPQRLPGRKPAKSRRGQVLELAHEEAIRLGEPRGLEVSPGARIIRDEHIVPQLLLSQKGVIHAVNEAALRLLGFSAREVLFQPLAKFFSPRDVARFFRFLSTGVEAVELRGDFVLRTADATLPVQVLLATNGTDKATGPFFRAALIEQREEPGDAAWASEERRDFRDLVNSLDGVVWKADYPMRITFVSGQAERLFGYPLETWTHEPGFWEKAIFLEDRERVLRARQLAIRKGECHVLEYRFMTAERGVRWVRDSAVVSRTPRGNIRLTCIISDITDLKQAQEGLLQNKKQLEHVVQERTARLQAHLRSMELFCYGIAHDLKAPLRAMSAYSDLLLEQYAPSLEAEARDYLSRIGKASRHFGMLVESLLRYGRLNHQSVALQRVGLQACCARALDCLRDQVEERAAKVAIHCAGLAVWADPSLVQEILTNLIGNGIKFSRPGAWPVITVEARAVDAVEPAVRVSVTDNGIGISPEDSERIFDVFQRLRPQAEVPGTGIGLALVHRATELMNGRVGVYSNLGEGSTFWFELPPALQPAQTLARQNRVRA